MKKLVLVAFTVVGITTTVQADPVEGEPVEAPLDGGLITALGGAAVVGYRYVTRTKEKNEK
ncbi:MAG TPA: hypothetical protein VFV37_01735 [Luteibaculaceae bacterium]|nr:hypothetical protein [Luteibaculaceae bacterium]